MQDYRLDEARAHFTQALTEYTAYTNAPPAFQSVPSVDAIKPAFVHSYEKARKSLNAVLGQDIDARADFLPRLLEQAQIPADAFAAMEKCMAQVVVARTKYYIDQRLAYGITYGDVIVVAKADELIQKVFGGNCEAAGVRDWPTMSVQVNAATAPSVRPDPASQFNSFLARTTLAV